MELHFEQIIAEFGNQTETNKYNLFMRRAGKKYKNFYLYYKFISEYDKLSRAIQLIVQGHGLLKLVIRILIVYFEQWIY